MAASLSDIRLLLRVKSLPKPAGARSVFLTGGTGSIGSSLIPVLLDRGHRVRVLVGSGSKAKPPAGCEVVSGNALDANSYRQLIRPTDTFIHLVGVHQHSPTKQGPFREIDLVSAREAISVCAEIGMRHFVYLSVAHPAPFMKDYVGVRAECEQMLRSKRLNATVVRPWYVLGPEHRWPSVLLPFYKLGEWLPWTRAAALRLGMVTIEQLIFSLVEAVETPSQGMRIVEVPEIRSAELHLSRAVTRKIA